MIYIKFEVPTTIEVEDNSKGIKRFLAKSTIGILKKKFQKQILIMTNK